MIKFGASHWRDTNDYRGAFLRRTTPFLGSIWICSQCMVPILGNHNVQVDHIFPPSKALLFKQSNNILATLLNTEMNTAPICPACNVRKSNKVRVSFLLKGIVSRIMTKLVSALQKIIVISVYIILLCVHFALSRVIRVIGSLLGGGSKKGRKRSFSFKGLLLPAIMIGLVIMIVYMSSKL